MKILILGGTGFIGRNLIPKLLEKDHSAIILTRNKSKFKADFIDKVTILEGDPKELGSWTENIEDIDVIINLTGQSIIRKRWSRKRKEVLFDSRIKPAEIIAHLISESKISPNTVISLSGIDYYPSDDEKEYGEEDPPGTGFMSTLCRDWENPIETIQQNVRRVIFRLAPVLSKGNKGIMMMFIPHKLFFGGWIGSGKQWLAWIHIEDAINAIVQAVEKDEYSGVYNLVAPEPMRSKQFIQTGGKILGRWTWTWMPGIALKILLGARSETIIGGRKVSSWKLKSIGFNFEYPTVEEALTNVLKN